MIKTLNQYKANYSDSTSLSVVAESMTEAINCLLESKDEDPVMLQTMTRNLKVSVPNPIVSIQTVVEGNGAVAGGCKATPYSINAVHNGEKVWFTAIPAEGFTFVGWTLGTEQVSTNESYEATISYAGETPTTLTYKAVFEANI